MLIKKNNSKIFSSPRSFLKPIKSLLKIKKFLIFSLVLLIAASNIVSIYYGMSLYKYGTANSLRLFFQNIIKTKMDIVPNMIAGILSKPDEIFIDIKYKDFQKLAFQRKNALENRFLSRSADDFVPARIRYKNKDIETKVRLKGDLTDHLSGQKWSLRVKIKDENTLFGMKRFSLQHPKTRNFIYEWLYLSVLKREGVISPRYKFINVNINGKDMGIYALEEHFDKLLLENNMRREGPIIKLDEDVKWYNIKNLKKTTKSFESNSFYSAYIDPFQTKKTIKNKVKYSQFIKALRLFESFRRGNLSTSEVFNIKTLAKYFAVIDLMSAQHSAEWSNLRFYYNPVISKLEPIGFNAFGSTGENEAGALSLSNRSPFYNDFHILAFNDPDFITEYVKALKRLSAPSYLDNLFSDLREELLLNLNILYKEFPYYNYSDSVIKGNQRFIRLALNPLKGLQVFLNDSDTNGFTLELGNTSLLPIEILNVSYKGLSFPPDKKTILPEKKQSEPIKFFNNRFYFQKNMSKRKINSEDLAKSLSVKYKILGTKKVRKESVYLWSNSTKDFLKSDIIRQTPNIEKFQFLTKDESKKSIHVTPGKWTLRQNLIIPKGYIVIFVKGTSLNLTNNSKIISYSALEFNGTKERPIFIYSKDSTGQGIVVINADKKSLLKHTVFKNLKVPSHNNWELSGAVTFYESDVDIRNSQFIKMQAEDSLNIVRSGFSINNSLFKNAFSDAIDIDFGEGEIKNSYFINTGDDAIDTSGSKLKLENIFIDKTGDKGLSAGENSIVIASNLNIKNAIIGVASKDLSNVKINKASITNCKTGLSLYQKKEEFGPGKISISNLAISDTDIPYLVKDNSSLIIDNKQIQ